MLAKHALSQLSYGPRETIVSTYPKHHHPQAIMVGLGGLEPPTSRLSSARSNQLSYKPVSRDRSEIQTRTRPALCPTERETKTAGPANAVLTGLLIF
jgi:hypothetical protein